MLVDSNLPVERDKLKNRLVRLVKEDEEIIGCFFGGSIGSKEEDYYSDIDARIVVIDGVDLIRKQQDIIKSIGEYLFVETFTENYSVINYATFVQLDLFVYRKEMLEPSIWMKQIDIVKDDEGILADLRALSQGLEYEITQGTFDAVLNEYYGYYFELYRAWRRGEPNNMEAIILNIKQHLVSMWYLSKGEIPNYDRIWSKYEGKRSKLSHLETEFLLSYTPCPPDELYIFTKKIEILMLEATEKVAAYNHLEFSPSIFRRVHDRISFKVEEDIEEY